MASDTGLRAEHLFFTDLDNEQVYIFFLQFVHSNMASAREVFYNAVRKLAKIPCSDLTRKMRFSVSTNSKSIWISVRASSHFECALKFGYFLAELSRLDTSTEVEIVEHKSRNLFKYHHFFSTMIVNNADMGRDSAHK